MGNDVLELGGILPLDQGCPDQASHLLAVQFDYHGRPIVRLVAEELVTAEELTLGALGVSSECSREVGAVVQRAVGFPAWPIMHDPDNARHALNLVGDLEWARKSARNRPKQVKERFDALTTELTASAPHFVPTLLEELSRIFYEADSDKLARQYFSKAREIERSYDIPVDPDRHQAVFLEFAIAGVVSARDMTIETTAALQRFADPKDAYEYLFTVNLERVRAGVEPYAYLVRDLRKAGKAAGIAAAEVDNRIIDAFMELKATYHAPAGFWKAIRRSLVPRAAEVPAVAAFLLATKPASFTLEQYFELLNAAEALVKLRQDRPKHAAWLIDVINRYSVHGGDEASLVLSEVNLAADALQDRTITAALRWLPLSVLDALLEYGVHFHTVGGTHYYSHPCWDTWLGSEYAADRRPLAFLAKHPTFRRDLLNDLTPKAIATHVDVFLANEPAFEIVLERLDEYIEQRSREAGSIPRIGSFLDSVATELSDPKLRAAAGGRIEQLLDFDAAESLQLAIRSGTLAEYTWPTYEQALARVRERSGTNDVRVFESYPAVAVASGSFVEVIDGEKVLYSGELPVTHSRVSSARFVDGDVVVTYMPQYTYRTQVIWLDGGAPKVVDYINGSLQRYSLPVAQGRLTAHGLITPGDVSFGSDAGSVLASDATGAPSVGVRYEWSMHRWDGHQRYPWTLEGIKPLAELLGLDRFGFDASTYFESAKFAINSCVVIPAQPTTQDSPFGQLDGVHISLAVLDGGKCKIFSALGNFEVGDACGFVVRRPGGGFWLGSADGSSRLADIDSGLPVAVATVAGVKADVEYLPEAGWHQLQPRDVKASAVMRAYTRQQAERVLAALQTTSADADVRDVLAQQLGTTDPSVIEPVVSIAETVHQYTSRFEKMLAESIQPVLGIPGQPGNTLVTTEALAALKDFADFGYSYTPQSVSEIALAIGALRDGGTDTEVFEKYSNQLGWLRLSGQERFLLALVGSPMFAEVYGEQVLRDLIFFLRRCVELGVLAAGRRYVELQPLEDCVVSKREVIAELHDCNVLAFTDVWGSTSTWHVVKAWVPATRRSKFGALSVMNKGKDFSLDAPAFLAGLDAIEEQLTGRRLRVETLSKLAQHTPLTPEGVMYMFTGMFGLRTWNTSFLSAEQREVYGWKATTATAARIQVRAFDEHLRGVLSAAVPQDNVADYIHHGPDADAVLNYWKQMYGPVELSLTNKEYTTLNSQVEWSGSTLFRMITGEASALGNGESLSAWQREELLGWLLTLAEQRSLDDPTRPLLAQRLAWLRGLAERNLGQMAADAREKLVTVDFGSEFEKLPNARQADFQARLLAEGHFDALIDDLREVYARPGDPHDPAVSAPEIVDAVAKHHEVTFDAARYYLQLLALMRPTDANIRLWNGWRKKDIDRASEELVARGLIEQATRSGAGRSRFLPGGWLRGISGSKPVEVWKAPLYLLWQDSAVRPIVTGAPALVPLAKLFAQAWDRCVTGDAPGYQELETVRYRSRRR